MPQSLTEQDSRYLRRIDDARKLIDKGRLFEATEIVKCLLDDYYTPLVLGETLKTLGILHFAMKHMSEAVVYYTEALKYTDIGPKNHRNLYLARRSLGLWH